MVHTNKSELDAAIAALSCAVEAIESRIGHIDQSIHGLSKKRRAYLKDITEQLLPAISGRVLSTLRQEVPTFVTSTVLNSFESNRKICGLFPGRGYAQALSLLQVRLSSHLDQVKFGELRSMDVELTQLSDEKINLSGRSKETLELLKLMRQAHQQNITLPAEVEEQIGRIAHVVQRNSIPSHKAVASSRLSSTQSSSGTSGNDDFDLWFYLVTDIPTSMRTLLFSAVTEHHHHDGVASQEVVGGRLMSGDRATRSGSETDCHLDAQGPMASGDNLGADASVLDTECARIATDDSLGSFS